MTGKTTLGGYGNEHQKLRKRWAPSVDRGEVVCARCNTLIAAKGEPCRRCLAKGKTYRQALLCRFDLDHVDGDKSRYLGPSHACCNRGAPSKRRARQRIGRRRLLPDWWPT